VYGSALVKSYVYERHAGLSECYHCGRLDFILRECFEKGIGKLEG